MRAEVEQVSDLVVIDTVPTGGVITVDGTAKSTPHAVTITSAPVTQYDPQDWPHGSVHSIEAPGSFVVTDGFGNTLTNEFSGWNQSAGLSIDVTADEGMPDLTASYTTRSEPPPEPPVYSQLSNTIGFDIEAALEGTPKGPFVRLTNGSLSMGGLVTDGFTITGDLFISLTKIKAGLNSSQFRFPETANPFGYIHSRD